MKWLYIGMGLLGAASPSAIFYIMHLDRTVPGTFFDLGAFFYGAAVSLIVIPVGFVFGLLVAAVIHLLVNMVARSRRSAPPSLSDFSSIGKRRQGNGWAGP
jgi:hypothetical protein